MKSNDLCCHKSAWQDEMRLLRRVKLMCRSIRPVAEHYCYYSGLPIPCPFAEFPARANKIPCCRGSRELVVNRCAYLRTGAQYCVRGPEIGAIFKNSLLISLQH